MSYKNRFNHTGRWRRNSKLHNQICDLLLLTNWFNTIDIIRMMR